MFNMNKNALEIACENYNPDIELAGSGNTDYGHYLAEQVLKHKKIEELEKRAELETHIIFVNAVDKSRIDVDNAFADRHEKENLIRKYAPYTKLNGSGKKELLENCSDYKIGLAFKNIYVSALNKIKRYSGEGK